DPEPTWTQGPSAGRCGACHGLPPPAPHSAEPRCGAAFCHGAEVAHFPDGPRITETGRASHIDGIVGGTP
ncbi:MAG: hypothetical protein OEY14_12505, partial [Myxococcales bacterium]|nr:hypothetical protein [Myxococcales bacterium]